MTNDYQVTETLQKYYDKVFQDGKLVNLHIGMWGMGYKLTEEDIKLENKLPDTIDLGKKMLIKKSVFKKFKNLEQKSRKYLYTSSFAFPMINLPFVPKSRYIEVQTNLYKYRDEFMQMVDEFIDNYEGYKQEAIEFYMQHKDTVNVEDLEKYYPSAANVRSKFYFEIGSFEIALPTEFKELNLQDEIDREIAGNEAKLKAFDSYKKEYNKQISTHMAKINDFVGEVTATLRSKVVEHCSKALQKINKKEVVSESSVKTLLKHIQEFRDMNFVDDKAVENELAKVERLLVGNHDFSKDEDAIGLLREHLSTVVKEAENLSDVANVSGEYFRKLS